MGMGIRRGTFTGGKSNCETKYVSDIVGHTGGGDLNRGRSSLNASECTPHCKYVLTPERDHENFDDTDLGAREGSGRRLMSAWLRRGGVSSLAGGVDASDNPEDPAVEGRPSPSSLLATLFLRAGTPSGHEHWRKKDQRS